ncbi:MAG: hypothetical protein ABIB71_00720 [Candidatus Woesearchaeota archaeon]
MPEDDEIPTTEMQVSTLSQEDDIPVPTPTVEEEVEIRPRMPMPQIIPQSQPSFGSYEEVQSLVEEVIDEKWKDFVSTIGDLSIWKSQMSDENEAIKQEILRMQSRIDNLQAAVLGKVDEYSKGVKNISTDMQALEKVFEKILEPMTSNIKELNRIVLELRKKK